MTTDPVLRMVPLGQGKRQPIRLDAPTWQAVDWLAGNAGQTWQQWCGSVIDRTPEDQNFTAAIREAAMSGILAETILAQRASLDSIADRHPLLLNSSMMDDIELADHMRSCEVWGMEDLGGFKLHVGRDEFCRPCIWIENGMKDWPSVVLPMPGREE